MINYTMLLTINGTRRSEKSGGLDDGEISTYQTNPGEYRKDFETIEDVIDNVNQMAYKRGEWISSLKLDGHDIIEEQAIKILQDNMLNIGESAIELSQIGMFSAADLEDLISFLLKIKSKNFNVTQDEKND